MPALFFLWGKVDVKAGVGDNVTVGVKAGNTGVKVETGDSIIEMGTNAVADCVRPETMVCAIAVFMEFESDVEIPGTVQAWETINKTVTNKRIGVDFSMFPPLISNGDHNTKT